MRLAHFLTMCRALSTEPRPHKRVSSRWPRSSHIHKEPPGVYESWLASRTLPDGSLLIPGAARTLNRANAGLAWSISRQCTVDVLGTIWRLHPYRLSLMLALNVLRSLVPAFRGYSQALIIDEIQSLLTQGDWTWNRIIYMVVTEGGRRIFEGLLDSFAVSNETIVHNSSKFFMEYQQLEQRVKLDIPTLADPNIRDLLHESDLFARSFSGMGGFGMLSPFDSLQIIALVVELGSHLMVLWSLTGGTVTHMLPLLLTIFSAVLPLFGSWFSFGELHPEELYTPEESEAAERAQKLQNLAYSDSHRPEILVFGLQSWILSTWAQARRTLIKADQARTAKVSWWDVDFAQAVSTLQNVPLFMISRATPASLGTLALWRSTMQAIISTTRHLWTTMKMAFQSVFLMASFSAAMKIRPQLEPARSEKTAYVSHCQGMKIEARGMSYTYPGATEPAVKRVSFTIEAGETVCIVGYNGSGKSTLANLLLRLIEFDEGELLVNEIPIRKLDPAELHSHATVVLQDFAKHNASVHENVGTGYVVNMTSAAAIHHAVELAGASHIVGALPDGMQTVLAPGGFEYPSFSSFDSSAASWSGLSGGEWQRIAISRAFMRAEQPEVDLLLFDEPTSALDGHAQSQVFDTISRIGKGKTTVFITHRLSTARRADKILMMAGGEIFESGSHEELMRKGGAYASLYTAST